MNKNNNKRKLIIVPILHTKEDMGSLGNHLPMTDGYTAMVSNFWQEVKEKVKQYASGITRVKVYQDGLPDTEEKLVEYKFTSELVRSQENTKGIGVKAASLLAQRDAYIANRIDNTLSSGELGILFIGAAHDIKEKIPVDIQVEIL